MNARTSPDSLATELAAAAQRSEELHRESRRILEDAVRRGAAAGMSQRAIAAAVGRSQPEVARLLRFLPCTPKGRVLARSRREVLAAAEHAGFRDVRVFGSVARGEDRADSDIDLLVVPPPDCSLFQISHLELALAELLGVPVDVVPEPSLREEIRSAVLADAVRL